MTFGKPADSVVAVLCEGALVRLDEHRVTTALTSCQFEINWRPVVDSVLRSIALEVGQASGRIVAENVDAGG